VTKAISAYLLHTCTLCRAVLNIAKPIIRFLEYTLAEYTVASIHQNHMKSAKDVVQIVSSPDAIILPQHSMPFGNSDSVISINGNWNRNGNNLFPIPFREIGIKSINYFENGNRIDIVILLYQNGIRNWNKIYFPNGNCLARYIAIWSIAIWDRYVVTVNII